MILKAHFFYKKGSTITLYPTDSHVSTIATKAYNLMKTDNQVVVHRDGGLIYYFFLRRVVQGIIGIGFSSGELCTSIKALFDRFNSCVENFTQRGILFCYNNDGDVSVTPNGETDISEINAMLSWLKNHPNEKETWEQLPPEDYSLPKDSTIFYNLEESEESTIIEATRHYGNIVVTLNNPIATSYSEIVKRLSSEKENLIKERDEITEQFDKLKRQKKQYEAVIGLAIAMFIGAVIFIAIISDKNTKIENQIATIQNNEETITNQGNTISSQTHTINEQSQSISRLENRIANLENEKDELQVELSSFISDRKTLFTHKPFIVTHTSFSFDRGQLTVYYYAPNGGTANVRCRVIRESDNYEVCDYSYTLSNSLSSGYNDFTLSGLTGLSSSQWYRFEIYSNGNLCGGGRH